MYLSLFLKKYTQYVLSHAKEIEGEISERKVALSTSGEFMKGAEMIFQVATHQGPSEDARGIVGYLLERFTINPEELETLWGLAEGNKNELTEILKSLPPQEQLEGFNEERQRRFKEAFEKGI